jgi:hypothetical protein
MALAGGRLAQLVERFVYTEDVGSSSLSSPTIPTPSRKQEIRRSEACEVLAVDGEG